MPYFGTKSTRKLNEVDSRLQDILNEAIKYVDFTIITGRRGMQEQNAKYNATPKQSYKQWPDSMHNKTPSLAVDISPWPIPVDWGENEKKEWVKFYMLAAVIQYVAASKGIKIRWGGAWHSNSFEDFIAYVFTNNKFDDLLHFEVIE